jgi:hypothetical protein
MIIISVLKGCEIEDLNGSVFYDPSNAKSGFIHNCFFVGTSSLPFLPDLFLNPIDLSL